MTAAVVVPADVLAARAYLSRVAEPASVPVWALVREHGPVRAAEMIRAGDVSDPITAGTSARRAAVDPAADLEAAARHGIRLVVPESGDWPHLALAALEHTGELRLRAWRNGQRKSPEGGELLPPLALWVKGEGDLSSSGVRSAALVGSRAATAYGQHVTAQLAYGLAAHGVTIVSGGAYGIDAAAHRAALAAEGVTVVVSAGGVDRPYPAGNAYLYERAAESGLVISESPPGCAPQRHRFLTRNRLIAALSAGTVVVEAAARSGALNTAAYARMLGRPLMVVPGPVTSAMSAGCHQLLRREANDALLVESVDHVLAVVGSAGEGLATDTGSSSDVDPLRRALDQLDLVARQVFDGLPARRAVDEGRLAALSGVSVLEVIRALPTLRLAGLVESTAAGHRVAPSARPGSA